MGQTTLSKYIITDLLIGLLTLLNFCMSDSVPEVRTEFGTFIGHTLKTRNGRDIHAYEGIPFAKPPVGNLRFQEPLMVDKSDQVYNASKVRSDCFQEKFDFDPSSNDYLKSVGYTGAEDCLYLNVYVPKVAKDAGKLAVMFFIHPGGYVVGSGSPEWNGPAYLLDRDIIMVSINYRLSVLGFLNIHNELPENLGLKDQNMALKWVKKNIAAFGGDPDLITIAGESSGSASASLHMHSPLSRGLFQRAIVQSGTIDCLWALRSRKEARKIAYKIITDLGCSTESQLLLRCLQKMPVEELFNAVKSLRVHKTGFTMFLAPVIETESSNAFITHKSIDEGSNAPMLAGVTSEEGLMIFNDLLGDDPTYADLTPLNKDYKTVIPLLSYYSENPKTDDITNKLVSYYMSDEGFNNKTVPQFVKMISDTLMNHGLHATVRNHKGKVYEYLFDYYVNQTLFPFVRPPTMEKSVSHGEEMLFLFNMDMLPLDPLTGEDLKFSSFLIDLWSNFVRFGDPTPDSKLWKESEHGSRYLEFTNDGHTMKTNMFRERMEYLDSIGFDKLHALEDK